MFEIENITENDKKTLTISLLNVLESWEITEKEKVILLGLGDSFKARNLSLFKNGEQIFPYNQHILDRAQIILGIYDSLGTTYPTSQGYGCVWLKRPTKKFDKKTPIEIMLSGSVGMKRIWHFLDCTQTWD